MLQSQPQQRNQAMATSRLSLLACTAVVAATTLFGSAHYSPASALDLSWVSNDNYVRCLKYVSGLAHGDPAAYDRGRRACNRQYYANKPGVDY
jgi:hypothetical protein